MTPDHEHFTRAAALPMDVDMSSDLLTPLAPGDEDPVISLLRAGIPLSLLLDLAVTDPLSNEIYQTESH